MKEAFNKEPLISVIIPVYKVEKYLDKCIDSVVKQTYKNFEIILVDDGSPDKCPKICDNWAKKDKRIKVIHKKNEGVSSARNTGIKSANGAYIGFVDSDDYIVSNFYEILYKFIKKFECDMAVCDLTKKENKLNNTNVDENYNKIIYTRDEYAKKFFKINSQTCEYYPVNKLYKKSIVPNDMFPLKYSEGEDAFGVLKTIIKSQKIVYIPLNLYYYNYNSSSTTSHFSATDIKLVELWSDIEKYVKSDFPDYNEYVCINKARINFTVLVRCAMNYSRKELKNSADVKTFLNNLKRNEKLLLHSSIRFDRKILIFLFCRNYYLFASILKVLNHLRRVF